MSIFGKRLQLMKKIFYFIWILAASVILPQNAQDYFPQQAGFKWNFKITPLDSLSNPMDTLSYYQIDTFSVSSNYEGKLSNILLSKSGTRGTIDALPYMDSSFINLSSSDANIYFKTLLSDSSLSFLDSTLLGGFKRYEGWYDVYKFGQAVNQQYTIFTKDTTITFDTLSMPLRFEYKAKRAADETITTELGSLTCKKFIISQRLSYLMGISPFIIPVKIVEITDTNYIAPNYWIVRTVQPTAKIDLGLLGYGVYYINGSRKDIIQSIPLGIENTKEVVNSFQLKQNFPNPFNPSTTINFAVSKGGVTVLKVVDILGQEKTCLINKYLPQGNYSVSLDAANWASGVYIYSLEINGSRIARKMVLQK